MKLGAIVELLLWPGRTTSWCIFCLLSTLQIKCPQFSGTRGLVDVPAHVIIDDYNTNMGGVERNDQMTAISKSRKQMRWYMRLVIKLLDAAAFKHT